MNTPTIITRRLRKHVTTARALPQRRDVPLYYISKRTVSAKELDRFFELTLQWCETQFGVKGRTPVPYLEWQWNNRECQEYKYLGLYDWQDNTIWVRIQGHRTIYNLAKTIIHEYIHYLQPQTKGQYDQWDEAVGYWDNPYEIEAEGIAGLYNAECVDTVLRWMGKSNRSKRRGSR